MAPKTLVSRLSPLRGWRLTSDLVSLQMCQHARPGVLVHWNSLLVPKKKSQKSEKTIEIHLLNVTYSMDLTSVTSDLVSLQMCQHSRPGVLAHWNSLLVPKEHVSLLKTNFYYKFNVESANVSTHDARRLSALELTAC